MTRYWNGISFQKKIIKEDGKEKEVCIAMTEDEANDRSYREYLSEAVEEKTRDELRKQTVREPNLEKREEIAEQIRWRNEFEQREEEYGRGHKYH